MNERLRKKGRWVFLGLAVLFGVMFVFSGVGTGGPSMMDLLQQERGDTSTANKPQQTALKAAQQATKDRPNDPQAWLGLAAVELRRGNYAEAAEATRTAKVLANDDVALQEKVANAYLAQAGAAQAKAQTLYATMSTEQALPTTIFPGQSLGMDAFNVAAQERQQKQMELLSEQAQPLQEAVQTSYSGAIEVLDAITKDAPDDPATWYRLGEVQAVAGQTEQAIVSLKRFVEIAPSDPIADQVKTRIDDLEKSLAPPPDPQTTANDRSGSEKTASPK